MRDVDWGLAAFWFLICGIYGFLVACIVANASLLLTGEAIIAAVLLSWYGYCGLRFLFDEEWYPGRPADR